MLLMFPFTFVNNFDENPKILKKTFRCYTDNILEYCKNKGREFIDE